MSDPFFIFELETAISITAKHAKACMEVVNNLRRRVDTRDAIIKGLQESVSKGIMAQFTLRDKIKFLETERETDEIELYGVRQRVKELEDEITKVFNG